MSHLSDDAVLETVKILNTSNEDLRKSFAWKLYKRTQGANSLFLSRWQALNVFRTNADRILKSRMSDIEPYKDFLPKNPDTGDTVNLSK